MQEVFCRSSALLANSGPCIARLTLDPRRHVNIAPVSDRYAKYVRLLDFGHNVVTDT